ncbi:MAG: hypothetical protein WBD16_12580 [Pyrinomonadaceae bacterium]
MNEKTITFIDAVTKENAVVIIRQVGGHVGVCISLEENGDVELFLSLQDLGKFISAVQEVGIHEERTQ